MAFKYFNETAIPYLETNLRDLENANETERDKVLDSLIKTGVAYLTLEKGAKEDGSADAYSISYDKWEAFDKMQGASIMPNSVDVWGTVLTVKENGHLDYVVALEWREIEHVKELIREGKSKELRCFVIDHIYQRRLDPRERTKTSRGRER